MQRFPPSSYSLVCNNNLKNKKRKTKKTTLYFARHFQPNVPGKCLLQSSKARWNISASCRGL